MKEPVVYFAWQTPAEQHQPRTNLWWVIVGLLGIAMFAYALYSKNFAFAVMLVMFGVILMIAKKPAQDTDVVISDQGVLIGQTVFPYSDIREYTLIPDSGLLYFYVGGILASHVHVQLPEDIDVNDIRVVLNGRVLENPERTTAATLDAIAKKLRLF